MAEAHSASPTARLQAKMAAVDKVPDYATQVLADIERGTRLLAEELAFKYKHSAEALESWREKAAIWRAAAAAAIAADDEDAMQRLTTTAPQQPSITSFYVLDCGEEQVAFDLKDMGT